MALLHRLLALASGAAFLDVAVVASDDGPCGAEELADFECADGDAEEALTSLLQLSHEHLRSPASAGAAGGHPGSGLPAGADSAAAAAAVAGSKPLENETAARAALARSCGGFDCLKGYVDLPDSAYSWRDSLLRLHGEVDGVPWTGSILNMTSQRWLSPLDVQLPAWSHGLVIITPDRSEGGGVGGAGGGAAAAASVGGWATIYTSLGWYGSPRGAPFESISASDPDIQAAATIAILTGAPAAVLYAVPPEVHTVQDNVLRSEDELMAHGMLRFLRSSGAATWLVELPMAKSIVRAMDTVAAFLASSSSAPHVDKFTLMGTSKRAAATWHAAAVDSRVKAIVPIAKALDTATFVRRTLMSLGGIPVVGAPYMERFLVEARDPVLFAKIRNITDPVNFADRYQGVAKLIISAAQDEYFMPDHTSFWLNRIPGPKSFIMVTEGGHIIGGPAVLNLAPNIAAFIRSQMLGEASPPLTWQLDRSAGRIEAHLPVGAAEPLSVELWQARTCGSSRRDFRLHNFDVGENCTRCGVQLSFPRPGGVDPPTITCENQAVRWHGSAINATGPGDANGRSWIAQVSPPEDGGWAAFFLRFEFPGPLSPSGISADGHAMRWRLATEVIVVPDTYPFPDPGPDAQGTPRRLVLAAASGASEAPDSVAPGRSAAGA